MSKYYSDIFFEQSLCDTFCKRFHSSLAIDVFRGTLRYSYSENFENYQETVCAGKFFGIAVACRSDILL